MLFKFSERYHVKVFHIVVLNYFVAAAAGFALTDVKLKLTSLPEQPWIFMALLIGILFIIMFFLIGKASREVGVSITTVATKMSVVLPISFSIFYYMESLNWMKSIGIVLAIAAVVLTVTKKNNVQFSLRQFYFPALLFLGTGVIDSLIKYAQQEYLDKNSSSVFSGVLFSIAALSGIIASILKREKFSNFFESKTLLFGIALGAVNFGSLYFIIQALGSGVFDSSIVFGLNNVGVVLVSVVGAILLFREKLSWINWAGIATSILAIGVLANA